jgi:drug/metabolite transporter (DMT)-like permease
MWLLSLALVVVSAGLHASWNLIVKAEEDKLISAWLTVLASPLLLWPYLVFRGLPPSNAWPILLASGCVHAAYNLALVRAYEHGDLSAVYPIARGLAPVLVALAAPVVLHERLSQASMAAVFVVGGGIGWLGLSARKGPARRQALGWAGATAACIATYSMVDKVGVLRADPVAYIILLFTVNAVVLAGYVLAHRDLHAIGTVCRRRAGTLALSGLCSLVAYLLVLFALRLTQVAYIAALRESSVVIAALLGWKVLREPFGAQRIAASLLVGAGLLLLVITMRG